jgi:hypothetical protein
VAVDRTHTLLASSHNPLTALTAGYDRAFAVAAALCLVGLVCSLVVPGAARAKPKDSKPGVEVLQASPEV